MPKEVDLLWPMGEVEQATLVSKRNRSFSERVTRRESSRVKEAAVGHHELRSRIVVIATWT